MSINDLREIRLGDPWWAAPASLAGHASRMDVPEQRLRTLLVPLALAEGQGLPVALWPPLASAVAGYDTRSELASPSGLTLLGPFVDAVQGADGRTLMRIAHPAVAQAVRDGLPDTPAAVQLRLTAALLEQVPDQDWSRADPYVCDHIAGHALAAGRLNDVLTDPGLFVYADPVALRTVLEAAPHRSLSAPAEAYKVWSRVMERAEAAPRLRAALLEMAFVADELPSFAEALHGLGLDLPWRTRWSAPGRGAGELQLAELPRPDGEPLPVVAVATGRGPRIHAMSGGEVFDADAAALRYLDPAEQEAGRLGFSRGEDHVRVFRRADGVGAAVLSCSRVASAVLSPGGVLVVATANRVTAMEMRPETW